MWLQRDHSEKKDCSNSLVAVAIDKDNKGSQFALKWAVENLLVRGQTVVLINVKAKTPPSHSCVTNPSKANDTYSRELFLPFRCLCTRKDIQSKEIVLEEADVTKSLIEFVNKSAIDVLVMGAASKGGFLSRFGKADIPNSVSKGAPDFCTVYVISKGKISSMRSSTRPAPQTSALRDQIANSSTPSVPASPAGSFRGLDRPMPKSPPYGSEDMNFRSPFNKGGGGGGGRQPKSYLELLSDSDVSFISSGRTSVDRMYPPIFDSAESAGRLSTNRLSTSSDISLDGPFDAPRRRSVDTFSASEFSGISSDDGTNFSWSSNYGQEDADAEMRRLKLELKQTMDMYSNACKEAVTAKQKAMELQKWKIEEEKKVEETRLAEETVKAVAEKEKTNARAALEAAEASKRIAELESQKRVSAEMRALKDTEERKKTLNKMKISPARYRKYTIDEIEAATEFFQQSRKIGEGGYGPVYKAYLDHTQVAIKVLRPDAAQGRAQFQQEVEILSCIRHPNMVLLLGACPEYGCLVYEYMHNGSLEDRLFCKGGTPPIPWQHRFRIAAEIAIGLLFLHQTKPEPLVHRDLKPANILLDRNMVSKISDVGLARLVPPSVADSVTQYRMTATAGTFCYIDPEYQQTGMLGVKSDVYSLGVMLLQIITAKPPMGLTHYVEQAIETDTFKDMLDPAVKDWPVEEALKFAKLAIQCAELRRRDRPDLCSVILPELNRLKMLGEESIDAQGFSGVECFAQTASHISVQQDVMSCPPSQCDSERSS